MPDAIRLVCPECDAVHRVKEITLGKLYRCKKCKSGLITMTPAVLACPSCGATTPPSHIEVSRLITCQECEDAPLMTVRFAGNNRASDTRRDSSRLVAREAAIEPATLFEDAPAESTATHEPEESGAPEHASPKRALSAELFPVSPEATPQNQAPQPATRVLPPEEAISAPSATAPTPPEQMHPEPEADESTATPEQRQPSPIALAESAEASAPDTPIEEVVIHAEPHPSERRRRINDTAFITRRSAELLEHAEQTLAASFEEPQGNPDEVPQTLGTHSTSAAPAAHETSRRKPPASALTQDETVRLSMYSDKEMDTAVSGGEGEDDKLIGIPYGATPDIRQLRQLLQELQQPYVRAATRNQLSVPAWIPIAFALLLCALFGWQVGEIDSLRQDTTTARKSLARQEEEAVRQQAQTDAEKTRLSLENQRLSQLVPLMNQLQNEKQRLENDLAELMQKYDTLRKNSTFLGPELGTE